MLLRAYSSSDRSYFTF
uniref:Uncharacterized protein n=1 Tax=Anguilla anguilla TaxID=7936 RepID=A0A0E9US93_ANGAN